MVTKTARKSVLLRLSVHRVGDGNVHCWMVASNGTFFKIAYAYELYGTGECISNWILPANTQVSQCLVPYPWGTEQFLQNMQPGHGRRRGPHSTRLPETGKRNKVFGSIPHFEEKVGEFNFLWELPLFNYRKSILGWVSCSWPTWLGVSWSSNTPVRNW